MKPADLQVMIDYNYWANARLLAAAEQVPWEKLCAPTTLSWGSVRDVLVHQLSAEWIWRMRIAEGRSPAALLRPDEFTGFAQLRSRFAEEETALRGHVAGWTEADLDAVVHYQSTSGKPFSTVRWQILLHVGNHGTQHRAEIAHFLTEYGASPGDVDLIMMVRRAGG